MLPLTHLDAPEGKPIARTVDHHEWLLVQQDCDLAWNAVAGSGSLLELRPVYRDSPPENWGIRAAKLLLDVTGAHLRADAPTVRVTPDVVLTARHAACPVPDFVVRLKTWLGLRYDRPAVPQEFTDLAKDIAARLRKKQHRQDQDRVRDVLATFSRAQDGTAEYTLVAVVPHHTATQDPGVLDSTRLWLTDVTLAVPRSLGIATGVDAYPDSGISLSFLEGSYALAVSTVSWPENAPGPVGATR